MPATAPAATTAAQEKVGRERHVAGAECLGMVLGGIEQQLLFRGGLYCDEQFCQPSLDCKHRCPLCIGIFLHMG
jgi:hypothetical protein